MGRTVRAERLKRVERVREAVHGRSKGRLFRRIRLQLRVGSGRLWHGPSDAWSERYFARAALMALKFGRSFVVGVCSAYFTTPSLPMTNAARAEDSYMPTKPG